MQKSNCIDCSNHRILADPDLSDWFCDDDVKVICDINERLITYSCRPHHVREESETPVWCPKTSVKYKSYMISNTTDEHFQKYELYELEDVNIDSDCVSCFIVENYYYLDLESLDYTFIFNYPVAEPKFLYDLTKEVKNENNV